MTENSLQCENGFGMCLVFVAKSFKQVAGRSGIANVVLARLLHMNVFQLPYNVLSNYRDNEIRK